VTGLAGDASRALLEQLADGRCHSGSDLGARLGRSRAAIWKQVRSLRAMGMVIESRPGQGYALPAPLELLSADRIRAALDPASAALMADIQVAFSLDSTSGRLLDSVPPPVGRYRALLAEYQTGGRGRRGRRWLSPLGSGLCLSLSWLWESPPRDLAALGLVVGVAVAEASAALGARDIGLKWPNDVVGGGGKLAGILVDVAGEPSGPLKVVAGVGMNLRPVRGLAEAVAGEAGALPPAALDDLVPGGGVSRNALAAALIGGLVLEIGRFAREGFLPFADRWRKLDWLYGRPVTVATGAGRSAGVARGIGADGALLLEREGQVSTVLAGDVSLRGAG
jgi:BirA family biotin operon repressor/biotin-[acetyl-CoA-carboxylase] ligase